MADLDQEFQAFVEEINSIDDIKDLKSLHYDDAEQLGFHNTMARFFLSKTQVVEARIDGIKQAAVFQPEQPAVSGQPCAFEEPKPEGVEVDD